ncbi:MAG TPA: hypothetical protein VNO26_03010 [Candidatus Limnocylindria bacterium]|nr:hypothetical protein [Candidatus Limnocylindria bacterium]
MRPSLLAAVACVLAGAALSAAGPAATAEPTSRDAALEAACVRLVAECEAARRTADRDPKVIEHPPGVSFKVTSPSATRHAVNAIAIARNIRRRFGTLPPACAKACDDILK